MLTRRQMIGALGAVPILSLPAHAEDREVIDARVRIAIEKMYKELPNTRQLAKRARGILVMPEVVKGGLLVGGSYGEGALMINRGGAYGLPAAGYYSVAAASFGFQAGVQTTSHALFFMTEQGLEDFRRADGWEVGADAEVTFPEAGLNAQLNSTLLEKPVIGVVFGQDGFLVGASLEGAKYSIIVR